MSGARMTKNLETTDRSNAIYPNAAADKEVDGSLAPQETATYGDTIVMNSVPLVGADGSDGRPKGPKTKLQPGSQKRPAKASPFSIETADPNLDEENATNVNWESACRGIPGWLSSLLIHLSLILVLALLSVNSGGKQIVDLLGGTSEEVAVEPYTTIDVVLQLEEIQTVSDSFETQESLLSQTSELAPVLDAALLSGDFSSELEGSLFDKVASTGLTGGELSRIDNAAAEFFGIEGEGSDFVFIIDCSDSMNRYGRWQQAIFELKQSINDLQPQQRFLILLYNNGYIAMNNQVKLVKSTEKQKLKAIRWLANNTPDSWTYCAEALADALKLSPSAIFLLSDGEFNDRNEVFGVLDRYKRKAKTSEMPQIPVHTVALGSHMGRFTMQRIARENQGKFKLIE